MSAIIWQSVSLFFMIFLGFIMKRIGFLTKSDGTMIAQIIMNVTLPAVIIVNFATITIEKTLLLFTIGGFLWFALQLTIAFFYTRHRERTSKVLFLFGTSGFNIGNFTLPFVQSVAPLGIPLVSMFDVGNNFLLSGANKIIVDRMIGDSKKIHIKSSLIKLAKSVPFISYLLMFIIRYFEWDLPEFVLTLTQPVAASNVFLSMFMIGLYLEFRLPKDSIKEVVEVLLLRYGLGAIMITLIAFSPLDNLTKSMLSLLALTPIPLFSIMLAVVSGVKEEVLGFAASISFLVSLPLMTLVLLIFH